MLRTSAPLIGALDFIEMQSQPKQAANWSASVSTVLLVVLLLLVVGIPTYPYWNYPEGPIRTFEARVAGASMISTSSYTLPKESVGILLSDGLTVTATVPHELFGLEGDLVTVTMYRKKITKTFEYRVTGVVEKAKDETQN